MLLLFTRIYIHTYLDHHHLVKRSFQRYKAGHLSEAAILRGSALSYRNYGSMSRHEASEVQASQARAQTEEARLPLQTTEGDTRRHLQAPSLPRLGSHGSSLSTQEPVIDQPLSLQRRVAAPIQRVPLLNPSRLDECASHQRHSQQARSSVRQESHLRGSFTIAFSTHRDRAIPSRKLRSIQKSSIRT